MTIVPDLLRVNGRDLAVICRRKRVALKEDFTGADEKVLGAEHLSVSCFDAQSCLGGNAASTEKMINRE
jgi:hypothetical protein